jgi:hypothetical protein
LTEGAPDDRLLSLAHDALDRLERGNAAFIPFTPTLTAAPIVRAVEDCAARRMLAVAIEERPTGIYVARRGP